MTFCTNSRAKNCIRGTCINYCTCPRTSFYSASVVPDIACLNDQCDPITVEAWNGIPGTTGATGTSVGIQLCEKLVFWTLGSSSLEVTKGSARVQIASNNIFYGHGSPPDDGPVGLTGFFNGDATKSALYLDVDLANFWYWIPTNEELSILPHWYVLGMGTDIDKSSVSIGLYAGATGQGNEDVAVGYAAARYNQGNNSVAVGNLAGNLTQGINSVAVGDSAGKTLQSANSVAVGNLAGNFNQSINSVAVGDSAGRISQSAHSVAVGSGAGETTQGTNSVAIGDSAGQTSQGARSVCIGTNTASSSLNDTVVLGYGGTATSNGQFVLNMGANNLKTTLTTAGTAGSVNQYLIVTLNGSNYKLALLNM